MHAVPVSLPAQYMLSIPYLAAGVTDEATLLSPQNKVIPDYYMPGLPDLLSVREALPVTA